MSISFVSLIIDRPKHLDLYTIAGKLEGSTINGYKVLATRLNTTTYRENLSPMPHQGHDFRCMEHPYTCRVLEDGAKHLKIVRDYRLEVVIEGAYELVVMETSEFSMFNGDVLVSLSTVQVYPDRDRTPLVPWRTNETLQSDRN